MLGIDCDSGKEDEDPFETVSDGHALFETPSPATLRKEMTTAVSLREISLR